MQRAILCPNLIPFLALVLMTTVLEGCGGATDSSSTDSMNSTGAVANVPANSDNVSPELVTLSASSYTVAPSSAAVMTITRSGATSGSVSAAYTTVDGTATAGTDYVATQGSVSWNDGESGSKTVAVPVMHAKNGSVFNFTLTGVDGLADFGDPASATVQVETPAPDAAGSSGASGSSSSSSSSSSGSGAPAAGASSPASSSSSSSSSSSGGTSNGTSSSSSSSGSSGSSGSSSGSSSSSGATPSTGTGSVTLSWLAPVENTNGSALTNLAGYAIYYGKDPTAMTNQINLPTVGMQTYVISNLASATWYFELIAINSAGVHSGPSTIVSAVL